MAAAHGEIMQDIFLVRRSLEHAALMLDDLTQDFFDKYAGMADDPEKRDYLLYEFPQFAKRADIALQAVNEAETAAKGISFVIKKLTA